MPREFDLGWVLGYYLIVGVINAGITLFWHMLLGPGLLARLIAGGEAGNPIIDFLLSPVFLLVGLFIGAGIVHLFLMLFRGGKHGFETTARVFAYSSGPQLFAVVPYIGAFVGGIWVLVLTVIGLREAHETSTGKALAALLVPVFFLSLLLVLLLVASYLIDPTLLTR